MRRLLFLAVLISVITVLGFWGGKKFCMTMMWPGSVNPSQSWYLALGLNDAQAQELKNLEVSFRKETDELCFKICKLRMDLLGQIRDSHADPNKVTAKVEEIGKLQTALEKEITIYILKVKKNLTLEQSETYLNRVRQELKSSIEKSGYSETP